MNGEKIRRYLFCLLVHPFLFLIRFFSYLVPREEKIWVFGHPRKFEGNGKYLFLHIQNNAKDSGIKAIWISRNEELGDELRGKGCLAVQGKSFQGIWYLLRAKYFITDTSVEVISYWLSGGAKIINLFHALPIKKMEQDVKKGESSEVLLFASQGILKLAMRFLFPWRFVKPDYVASPSPLYTGIFRSAFDIPEERIIQVGCPRTDVLMREIPGAEVGVDLHAHEKIQELKQKGSKVVLYAPTFRDTGDQSFLEEREKLEMLNGLLERSHAFFVVKVHPFTRISIPQGEYSHIIFVLPVTDSYPLLKLADVLVTDYSSIFVDFLLLDRPEIFFAYDLEKYVTKDRELYFDYDEFTPGPKAYTFEDFLKILEETLKREDHFKEARKRQRDLCFVHQDGNAAKRVFSFLLSSPS
ncbi:MAG: CDP-glycerol glycerophosphotransferase family protein [Patescibacteria group bacterium]